MTGLILWLVAGLVVGVAGRQLLPGPATSWSLTITVGLIGGLAGGLAATLMNMGGVAELDLRSAVIATLTASLAVLLVQLWRAWRS